MEQNVHTTDVMPTSQTFPKDMDQLQQTVRVAAGASLIAVICMFIDLRRTWSTMRKSPSRIIFWWSISITISLPAMLLSRMFVPQSPVEEPSAMCRLQGTLLTFGMLSSVCWAGCIALNLLIAIKWKFDVKVLLDAEKMYHRLCWGFPGLTSLIMLFIPDVYGDASLWCWISAEYEWLRLVLINVPTLLTMVTSLFMYAIVAIEISRTFNHSSHAEGNYLEVQKRRIRATNRFALKCSLYLLAFILSHSGEVAIYVALLFHPVPPYDILMMMAITIPGSGALIASAYFTTRLLKPPKGSVSSQDSFYSGGSYHSSRIDRAANRSADTKSGRSNLSEWSGRSHLNDSAFAGSSRGSVTPTIASSPSSTFQFDGFSRNSSIMPSLPPSAYHPKA